MRSLVAVFCLFMATASWAAEADPRAVEACKAESKNFVQIAKCLPSADVAVATFDAFDRIYPGDGRRLKTKCQELNVGDITGAESCVVVAIQSAVKLKASLPKGATIDDPVFAAVSDEKLFAQLDAARTKAKAKYPNQMIWGGGFYQPYE